MIQSTKSMRWKKKGLIYAPSLDKNSWMYSSALTPTPILLNEEVIRVYFGARDINGVSRVCYVDLASNNPSEVLKIAQDPVLDIGQAGYFDDNGVILGDIVKFNGKLRMYYVGFQKTEKVKFLAFTGAADSIDNGQSFVRVSKTPILDRTDEGAFFRAIHSVIFEEGVWKVWCGVGNKWTYIDNVAYPNYDVKYYESRDGIHFSQEGITCIHHQNNEYRIGRPRVYKTETGYEMYYTKGTTLGDYLPGRAVSKNGIDWQRQDNTIGISVSETGWDCKTLCYPSLLRVKNKTYMFYNGNNMGADGFGYAVLEE